MLMRHAKAGPQDIEDDHGRTLAPRGRRNAPLVGKAMRKAGFIPDAVLCSDAARTRETWALVVPELKAAPDSRFTHALYLAPWRAIVNQARGFPASADTVLMIGHNPGMEECAAALLGTEAGKKEQALRAEMAGKFPTGTLAVIDCEIAAWKDLTPGCGQLVGFIRPRDLD
jgi:phosphohistidine phosphatase